MNVAFNIFLNLHKPMWKKKVFKKNFFRGFNASFSTTDGEIFQKFLIIKVYLMEFFCFIICIVPGNFEKLHKMLG